MCVCVYVCSPAHIKTRTPPATSSTSVLLMLLHQPFPLPCQSISLCFTSRVQLTSKFFERSACFGRLLRIEDTEVVDSVDSTFCGLY